MKEKYLPIGTVVLLKNANKKLMITGFGIIHPQSKEVYDYSGCPYPEGIIDSKSLFMFNHEKIQKICYMGYESEENEKFVKFIKKKQKNEK